MDYTPEFIGSGQFGICVKCGKGPTKEGHDGCLGTLMNNNIMNACCGHGENRRAYVQRWTRRKLMAEEAISFIRETKQIGGRSD